MRTCRVVQTRPSWGVKVAPLELVHSAPTSGPPPLPDKRHGQPPVLVTRRVSLTPWPPLPRTGEGGSP